MQVLKSYETAKIEKLLLFKYTMSRTTQPQPLSF